ncbi:ankyrin-2-like isoform X4 [Aricia agestis]|uniref:ankyrin-2-like isoform X4 n=1 Tax=Aricia agestis TaxID=91739 RepID=UPI001C20A2B4|nr:ankyrin-2-like isoform X4 [Aricia agestis]
MTTETATPNQADASSTFLRAARAGQIEKIISLLEQGVDINVSNANGLNAIHLASKDGHVEVVRELLQRGAAIDAATKKGNTALHIASLAGQEAVVKLLVQNGAQVNIQSQNGFTPLYMAAQENHDGVVKFLLANGANQSLATEDGFTPLAVAMQQGHEKVVAVLLEADTRGRVRLPALHIAAKKDDVKAANLLLENEHNPDVTSKSGFTPLHIAAHYGNESVARLLLAKGADVNCAAKHNICPLHVAAKWGKENMVSLLCDNGANVEARTRDGLTPLHCAARSGHERVVEALLDRGAPITSKSKNGLAPLHMAAQGDHAEAARVLLSRRAPVDDVTVDYLTALHVAAHCGHAKVAKLLLDRNADANARALNGFTPLHIACKKNRIKVVELLLKYGASIQATTESGLTPLHVASFMGCMNIVIYLLQHEANPDVPTVRGETPLHLAARANQTDIIRILLRNGAAVEATARERHTPLHIASRLGNVDIAVLLLQHGADVRALTAGHYNALHIAAKHHNHDVASALIEHNAPLTATTKKGFSALHLAAKYGNLKVANLLLAHGASPDQAGKNGMTPLHVAAQYDKQAVANTLLEKGADAKAVAKNGHTPLHIAARKNQMETAATLLEYGALTNAESKAGFTPLHLAAQQGHTEMCSLLLEHSAEVDHQSKNGLAALHLAAQEDRVPVAQLLVKNGAEVGICTKGGYTPLHIASHYGQANMVRFLLENGASVKAQTAHGYTALHHAAQQGHINIVNILLEHKADANATTVNGQTPLDIASKLGYVTVMETLKEVSEPSLAPATQEKYKVVAPETMLETFMSDSEEEGGEDTILNDQPYRYLTADDMKSLGDDSLPIDVTKDERTESAMSHKNVMEISQTSMNGIPYQPQQEVVKSVSRYSAVHAPEAYCYNVDPTQPKKKLQWKNFLVSFLVDARGGALRGCRGGGVRVIVPPLSAQQPTRITCRYLKPSRINHMPPLMEGEALASRVLEMGPVSAKFLGPVILEVPHYASLRGKEREIVILRSDNGTSWREHNADATDDVVQDILHETLEIEDTNEDEKGWDAPRVTRILTHDFPQYFAVISRIRQEVHAIGPEGGMVSSSVVPQVQAVFPQGALTKKIKVGLQAQIIDSELTAKLLGRGVAVSPVVTVEPRRRKFHKAITLSMPAPRPHTQGMTNQYSTSSAPTLRLLCSISGVFRKRSLEGGTNRAHWEDVTENTPLTFVNDCVSFTTTVSARYWLIDCRHVEDATKMATELYREAIHVPFMARFVVYAKRTDECQAQLRMFCVTDDKEDKALERIERFIQVAKSRDVEVHEGKPIYLEFGGNLVPVAKSGEQLTIPFRAFRENRVAFPVMIKTQDLEPICRCQFMRDPKVPKGEPSPAPIAALNIMVPDDIPAERTSPAPVDSLPRRTEEQELIWRQRLSDPRLEDICNLLGKDWVALAYELGVSVATVNQIQAKRITSAEQAELMLKLWRTQSGTKAQDNSLELALCRIGRDDIIAPQSELTNERRIQRNIYQERQASEEIEAYKVDEDNKLKELIHDDNQVIEGIRTEDLDQDEAKYSPEEKCVLDKSEIERTPTPSEESEEDEDVKRSVAERKEQITKKLSSSKIPASKQKKEIREEIIEIKTQIKPDIKKFQDIEQQVKEKEPKLERTRSKTTPDTGEEEVDKEISEKTPSLEQKKPERPTDQFRKFDPSSPAKPTPKHLQRHMRNESMKFSSGDFSNVTITPRKSIPSDTIDTKTSTETTKIDSFSRDVISQKEIDSAKIEEKLDDGDKSPDLVVDEKDIAEATLKDKINAIETKLTKESSVDLPKTTVKLTKEALKKHTQEQDPGIEYTQAFIRDQSKQISLRETEENVTHKIHTEAEKHIESVKSIKETIQQFDSRVKHTSDKSKVFTKSVRTDSTLVQVSSEEDSEFLKKSTDSETETESQTTVKAEKDKKHKLEANQLTSDITHDLKKDIYKHKKQPDEQDMMAKKYKIEKQLTDELRTKVSEEEISETFEEKGVTMTTVEKDKAEVPQSISSTKSDISKHTKTDSGGSDKKMSYESTILSCTADSMADLQQSTEKDISFVSQTESKVYSRDSKQRSDSLDGSQFSELDDQIGLSPAHKPVERGPKDVVVTKSGEDFTVVDKSTTSTKDITKEFLQFESVHSSTLLTKEPEKDTSKESPVISAKARQFIETVPEDDSVQECFFSKRIYSDSLEDSEHTDSRRHSEAESSKSDQSDVKAKISSSDFDERAEYEGTADSGSAFGDEKFEESISGFTALKIDSTTLDSDKQEISQCEEPEVLFKKMTPKRHSRTESISISKLSDLIETEPSKSKQEFQMIVTEAEEVDRSFEKDDVSDKISSESSREVEISDKKSSEGISDKISSEDAVTDKKTSSEEGVAKDDDLEDLKQKDATKSVKDIIKQIEKSESKILAGATLDKDETKRQSVTSVESGSASELRLEEKRLSDAHSLTESRDYTFEESEDDIATQGTHVNILSKERSDFRKEDKKIEPAKPAKLTHGDSLDDVEGFPEDHVSEYVHKLPHISEISAQEKDFTSQFLHKEREEQLKRETGLSHETLIASSKKITDARESITQKTTETSVKEKEHEDTDIIDTSVTTTIGNAGEEITTTTTIEKINGLDGEEQVKTTVRETTKYLTGEVATKESEHTTSEKCMTKISDVTESVSTDIIKTFAQETSSDELHKHDLKEELLKAQSDTQTKIGPSGETITIVTLTEIAKKPSGEEVTKTTITERTKYPTGEESVSTKVSEVTSSVKYKSQIVTEIENIISSTEPPAPIEVKKGDDQIIKSTKSIEPDFEDKKIQGTKFDVSKIRTDTLDKFSVGDEISDSGKDSKKIKKGIVQHGASEISKKEVTNVVDEILQKGTADALARSPLHEKSIVKEFDSEKRSYDAKVPTKDERRHSCISPAISLERIAESETETEEDISKLKTEVLEKYKADDSKKELKKSDSAMKQMAENIEIIIKQASEDIDMSSEDAPIEEHPKDLEGEVSVDSIIEEAVVTVEGLLDKSKDSQDQYVDLTLENISDAKRIKDKPGLTKSLSRDSGETMIMPKKKQIRTFSVQSSPDEMEEQIYTDSESDMDKAKVLEIIEPSSEVDNKLPASSFDPKKMRTDSLDDADDFPEKETEYFGEDSKFIEQKGFDEHHVLSSHESEASSSIQPQDEKPMPFTGKKTHFVDSVLRSDVVSKSTTESSVTTVISTLTKSSEDDQKSIIEDRTSADLSKLSGAELLKDTSKMSFDTKDEFKIDDQNEDRGTPDLSKKSIDLTKDYSKSSIDSKDTSRDFATNELSKDSTADLTKDFSKVSIDSVRETSRSIDEKTFSEDHSSFDVSKTLASDGSDGITISKEFIEEERSISKIVHVSTSSSQETSIMTESKGMSEVDDKSLDRTNKLEKSDYQMKSIEEKCDSLKDDDDDENETENLTKDDSEVPDMKELNRRCSNLLEDISSQGALIRIDSSHVTQDLVSKFSKTPPPSPVDLIMKERAKCEEPSSDRPVGLHLKGSDSTFLDTSRQSPRASSAGDSLISETEAHQSELTVKTSEGSTATRPKSPTKHLADNLAFVNVDKPTITTGAIELVDRTIEKSIDVIDQIKKEQIAVKMEELQKSTSSDKFYSESRIETSTSSSSIHKTIESSQLKFENIDPESVMSDMIAKFGTTSDFGTVLSHKETETRKISGQEFFTETKQVSSSDDDSLIIKTETSHELRGQEHELKEKLVVRKDGDHTETSQKKMEKAHEATAKRSDIETKTVCKSTDDSEIIKVEREFIEQGLYTGRQTKSEERMTAIKDETVKKKHEVKISERDLSHEQWGKEYFTEPGELEDINEDEINKSKTAYIDTNLKIIEKDEVMSSVELSERGKIISTKVEHHKEESVIESKEHDDLSSDAPSFKSETVDKHDSSEASPKSKSKSFKKDDEVYEVDFIKEIKVSTSPVKSSFSRTGSQDTQSESEIVPDLPHDEKPDTPKKDKFAKSPIKLPHEQLQDQVLEISRETSEINEGATDVSKVQVTSCSKAYHISSDNESVLDAKPCVSQQYEVSTKVTKTDMSPCTLETSEDLSITSKDIMIKSGESIDTEYMIKSLESHEGEAMQKSIDSTVSAETLHPSEFSTEADSAFLTGTEHKREEMKLLKEKSTEDICSSGYDTDLSSAEFHAMKLESEKIDVSSVKSVPQLADLTVLEKTIDEVKQSLEAAQGELISEKSDGSIKYKQSPSEFQFKLLISPEKPEVITEEPQLSEDLPEKDQTRELDENTVRILESQISDSASQKISSQEETTLSDEDKDTVHQKELSPPLEGDISIISDSGPHSILETESETAISDKDLLSSKGSPEVRLRTQKHIKSHLGVVERRSASEVEGWSSSGESHYHSFEHSESRPLSSDIEVMMTAQSGTEFETALTSQDISTQSMRTSKDYFTAGSSLASRDSMKSLDSDASSHVASIDISDASETLVPSANELKEELMESSTYVEQFLHEPDKILKKIKDGSDEEMSGEDDELKNASIELVGKMKRSHEMRFQPKELIPEHFPGDSNSESVEFDDDSLKDKEGSDTTISSQFKTDEILSSSISKLDISSSHSQLESDKEEAHDHMTKVSVHSERAVPFSVTKVERPQRQMVDIESEIIPVGSKEYEEIEKRGIKTKDPEQTSSHESVTVVKKSLVLDESLPSSHKPQTDTLEEECIKKVVSDVSAIPFPVVEKPPRQRDFVDVESDIIPVGSKQYEDLILKSKSDSSVPKTKIEKSVTKSSEGLLDSKQSSTSSLKTHEHLSTPHTPLSAPSQSSLSTDNGREYIIDDMYDISETPELNTDLVTESSRSELIITTEDRTMHALEKEQESPTSDEFEIVDKPSEMDDFVVIEEVAREAQESDPEGKSVQIKSQKYVKRHDTEVEEYLSKASKKQESTSSTSGSLSDEELLQYEIDQKRLQAQELAEIEAGKRWIQMQFEGDPRYDYERVPLEDIKEEEMTDFDASRIGSLSSQKESIGSFGSFRNSYGSLSESEMASRMRFRIKGENDDISISSLQEFENLERMLMEQYQQNSSSSQDSLNGSLPRRYILSKSQGDDISVSSLKEFEGLESACFEALKAELLAKQKEALLLADPKVVSGSFLEQEKRSYDTSSDSSPPLKSSGSPGQKSGSPSQKSGSPSQKSGSPSQKTGSYGSPSQRLLADSAAIRKLIDQQLALEQRMQEYANKPKVVTVKKYDDKGAFFVPEPEEEKADDKVSVEEECKKSTSFVCASAPSDGSAESIPGDCEEMMKLLDQEEEKKSEKQNQYLIAKSFTDTGVVEVVRTTTVIQQKFVDGKKVSETVKSTDTEGAVDIPTKPKHGDESAMSLGSEMSSSLASQPSELESLVTVIERYPSDSDVQSFSRHATMSSDRLEDLDLSRESSAVRELSPSSVRSVAHSIISGKQFTDPASGSWSGQDEELSSSGSFSRARADLMLGSTDSLEATSSNATRATFNYEVDTPMTGSLTSGAVRPPGSNTMVSSLDTMDPVTAVQMESLEHQSTSEHYSQEYEVHEPDSDTERLELDGRTPKAKERTIMFDSTDTLSAVSGDGSVREVTVEAPAATFYIGDTPITRGERHEEEESQPTLSGSCPASLPPTAQPSLPVPAQRSCYCLSHSQEKSDK